MESEARRVVMIAGVPEVPVEKPHKCYEIASTSRRPLLSGPRTCAPRIRTLSDSNHSEPVSSTTGFLAFRE
jgi:hypothetical protein